MPGRLRLPHLEDVRRLDHERHPLLARRAPRVGVLADVLLRQGVDVALGAVAHRRRWTVAGGPQAWGAAAARRFGAIPGALLIWVGGLAVTAAVGLGLGFVGVAVLIGGRPITASLAQWPGILCVLCAAVFWALGTVMAKRLPLRMPSAVGTAWQILVGTIPLTIVGLVLERFDGSRVTGFGWTALGYTVASVGLGYVTWFAALRRLPASTAAVGTLLIPVIGVFSAALLLSEPLGVRQLAALALTLSGIALATRG